MNINKIKEKINVLSHDRVKIKINLGRNKHEFYDGYIDKVYPNIFTIKTDNGIRSISYSDIVTKNVIISKFN